MVPPRAIFEPEKPWIKKTWCVTVAASGSDMVTLPLYVAIANFW